jgi:hypothetical protein
VNEWLFVCMCVCVGGGIERVRTYTWLHSSEHKCEEETYMRGRSSAGADPLCTETTIIWRPARTKRDTAPGVATPVMFCLSAIAPPPD